MNKYTDRSDAGNILADQLTEYANQKNVIVLALPRGGVPVAFEVATKLSLPLDVIIVRKLGVPGHEELAMGAIASGGTTFFNQEVLAGLSLPKHDIDAVIAKEVTELERRENAYRGNKPYPDLATKTVILVDDGIATGSTMIAAIHALRDLHAKKIIVAIPVAEVTTCQKLEMLVDKLVCPMKLKLLYAVGQWYDDFAQTTDDEVHNLLHLANQTN